MDVGGSKLTEAACSCSQLRQRRERGAWRAGRSSVASTACAARRSSRYARLVAREQREARVEQAQTQVLAQEVGLRAAPAAAARARPPGAPPPAGAARSRVRRPARAQAPCSAARRRRPSPAPALDALVEGERQRVDAGHQRGRAAGSCRARRARAAPSGARCRAPARGAPAGTAAGRRATAGSRRAAARAAPRARCRRAAAAARRWRAPARSRRAATRRGCATAPGRAPRARPAGSATRRACASSAPSLACASRIASCAWRAERARLAARRSRCRAGAAPAPPAWRRCGCACRATAQATTTASSARPPAPRAAMRAARSGLCAAAVVHAGVLLRAAEVCNQRREHLARRPVPASTGSRRPSSRAPLGDALVRHEQRRRRHGGSRAQQRDEVAQALARGHAEPRRRRARRAAAPSARPLAPVALGVLDARAARGERLAEQFAPAVAAEDHHRWPRRPSSGSASSASLSACARRRDHLAEACGSSSRRVPPPSAPRAAARGQARRRRARSSSSALRTAFGLTKIARSNSCSRCDQRARRRGIRRRRGSRSPETAAARRPPARMSAARPCASSRGRVTSDAPARERPRLSRAQRGSRRRRARAARRPPARRAPPGSRRRALAFDARDAPAVGRGHQRAQPQPRALQLGVRAQRNRAAAAERPAHRALGAHAGRGRGVAAAARAGAARPRAPARHSMPSAAWPGAGRLSSGVRAGCGCARRGPGASGPAAASMIASYSPRSSLARRVSTLPRRVAQLRGRGWRAAICACAAQAGGADAPRPRQLGERGVAAARRTRRAGPRARGSPPARSPAAARAGTSFIECTARSARPSASALSSSFTNRPLPPTLSRRRPRAARRRAWTAAAARRARPACSASQPRLTCSACHSARRLRRVAMRRPHHGLSFTSARTAVHCRRLTGRRSAMPSSTTFQCGSSSPAGGTLEAAHRGARHQAVAVHAHEVLGELALERPPAAPRSGARRCACAASRTSAPPSGKTISRTGTSTMRLRSTTERYSRGCLRRLREAAARGGGPAAAALRSAAARRAARTGFIR